MQPLPSRARSMVSRHKFLPIHCPGLSQAPTHAATVTPTYVVLHCGCSGARSVQCKRACQAIGFDCASAWTDVTHLILPGVSEATPRAWIHWEQHIEARNVGRRPRHPPARDHAGDTQEQFADIQALFVSAYHVSCDMSSARSTPERPSIYNTCQPPPKEPNPPHRTARAIVTGAFIHVNG